MPERFFVWHHNDLHTLESYEDILDEIYKVKLESLANFCMAIVDGGNGDCWVWTVDEYKQRRYIQSPDGKLEYPHIPTFDMYVLKQHVRDGRYVEEATYKTLDDAHQGTVYNGGVMPLDYQGDGEWMTRNEGGYWYKIIGKDYA